MTNEYDANDTMRFLGKQFTLEIIQETNAWKDIQSIITARAGEKTLMSMLDCFMIGYIHGKRAERRRRKQGQARER